MAQLLQSILDQVRPTTLIDIGITALLIYWLFSLIRGTRAVRLVIGVSVLFLVYAAAQALGLRLLSQILQTGAVVGVFALVVVFQPELRRALERIGRVGSLAWLLSPAAQREAEHVAAEVARAAALLSAEGHGALIVLERETGLEEIAETGVMIHGDLSVLERRDFFRVRGRFQRACDRGQVLQAEMAAREMGQLSLMHALSLVMLYARTGSPKFEPAAVRWLARLALEGREVHLNEVQLGRALIALLNPAGGRRTPFGRGPDRPEGPTGGRAPRLSNLGGMVARRRARADRSRTEDDSAAPAASVRTTH